MRSIDRAEPLGELGRKVEPHKVTTPDREVSPGVFSGKDGKLYTALPVNEGRGWIYIQPPPDPAVSIDLS